MESADFQASIIHLPDPVIELFQADIFSGADGGNLDPVGVPADPSAGIDIPSLKPIRILKGSDPARHRTRGGGINRRRRPLVQSFMRTLAVEFQTETVETALLGGHASSRRLGGLGFKGPVHAFVAPILLRFAGLNELGKDPQTDPPGGKGGEPGEGVGGEGDTVIGSDSDGQTVLFEQTGEDGFCAENSGGMKGLASDEIAAEAVSDGEGEAVHAVRGFELALEISTPDVVRREDGAGGFAGMTDAAAISADGNHIVAFEDFLDRGATGEIPAGVPNMDDREDLFATPGRMLAAQFQQCDDNLRIGFIREVVGFARKVFEGTGSVFNISFDPFVSSLARNLIPLAEFGDGEALFRKIGDELNFLVHR